MSVQRPHVAYFSPLNPDPSGISDYSEELLPHLGELWELDLFVAGYEPTAAVAREHRIIDCYREDPLPLLAEYDAVLYQMGNSDSHDYIYETLMRWPGLVVLHELSVQHLVAKRTVGAGRTQEYIEEMRAQHGDAGAERARRALWGDAAAPWEQAALDFPLNRRLLGHATGVLAHSDFVAGAVRALYPTLLVRQVEHHATPPPAALLREREPAETRARDEVVFLTAGNLTPSKCVPYVLRTLRRLQGRVPFRYRLAGEVKPAGAFEDLARSMGLADQVECLGRVETDDLYRAFLDADVCICLREQTLGETSGIAMRALASGCPLVVSDAGWFAELPDAVAVKVPPGVRHGPELAAALEGLARDPERRRRMGEAARAWAGERDAASRARGLDAFVREGGLFPRRWFGRSFQSVSRRLRELDHEYAACAAKLSAAHLLELASWRNLPSSPEESGRVRLVGG